MSKQEWRPDPEAEPFERGLVQLFTGDGKGKTSAALGVILRAAGHGLRVHLIYFMKGDYPYGERQSLKALPNVTASVFGHTHFVDPKSPKSEEVAEAKRGLDAARLALHSGDYDVVVLDEINVAVGWKLLEVDDVLELIHGRPERVELMLTGRYADPKLIAAADLVTEMVNIKHPYEKGILSRKGIDY